MTLSAQPKLNITPHFDSEEGLGTVYIQISGYDTDDFCYTWNGPDGFRSDNKPPLRGLSYGLYSVSISDCNQRIAAVEGTACVTGEDYSAWEIFIIEGATCDGFGDSISYTPREVCELDEAITLFAPAVLPSCINQPTYQWYNGSHKISNEAFLENKIAGQYCVHITNAAPKKKCQCEAYICQYIPGIDENFGISLEAQPSKVKWLKYRPTTLDDFLIWEFEASKMEFIIEGFNPEITYSGYVSIKAKNNNTKSTVDIDMVPGHVTKLSSEAAMTNMGYGRFIIDSGQLLLGDELCVTAQDTCGNLLQECAKVSTTFVEAGIELESERPYEELVSTVELKKIVATLRKADFNHKVDTTVNDWHISGANILWWKNIKLLEVYNSITGQYFLLSAQE